jgi:hypothetical protein
MKKRGGGGGGGGTRREGVLGSNLSIFSHTGSEKFCRFVGLYKSLVFQSLSQKRKPKATGR